MKVPRPNPMVHATDRRDGDAAPVLGAELAYASDRRISNYDTKATAANEQDVARDRDAQALYEQAQAQWDDGGDTAATRACFGRFSRRTASVARAASAQATRA